MPLPKDTKYVVADALITVVRETFVPILRERDIDMESMQVTRVDRLNFSIRIRPRDGSGPRYIYVKVSEPY